MSHPSFEAVKVALKQDRTGYILTLNIHPNDLDERILRDFVGARYQVVMVRLNGDERPMNRDQEFGIDPVKLAGILCRDGDFHRFLTETGNIFEPSAELATEWLREELGVKSRSELREKPEAARKLAQINQEFKTWKQNG